MLIKYVKMKYTSNKLVAYLIFSALCIVVSASTFNDQRRLYEDLKKKTDNRIRPVFNQSNALNIIVKPKLIKIQALDERIQILFCTMVLEFTWISETMRWSPAKYGGTNIIHMSPEQAWLPDIVYQNTINDLFDMRSGNKMKITVAANGSCTWKTGSNLMSHCSMDILNYPFDTQMCKIVIGKIYSYDYEMMIIPESDKIHLEEYEKNDEWILKDNKVRYLKIEEQFHFVEFEVTLKRRPLYYLFNIVFPVILLSFMNVFTFKIPVGSGERISYSVSMLLTFCVFLSIVSEYLPKVSVTVSYLQLYISIQLGFCIITTIISILNINFAEYGKQVPGWIVTFYWCSCRKKKYKTGPLPRAELTDGKEIHENRSEGTGQTKCINKETAVRYIDNLFFWLFMLLFLLSTFSLYLKMTLV